ILRQGCTAAFSIDAKGEERLVIVQEVERRQQNVDADAIFKAIRQAVAENYELQVYKIILVKAGSIPKTSSGKIQRHACKAEFLAGRLEIEASIVIDNARADLKEGYREANNPTEEMLAAVWTELLGLERIGVDENFF